MMPARRRFGAFLTAVVVVVLAGCHLDPPQPRPSPSATPSVEPSGTPSSQPASALVTIETRGGECPNGPCGSVVAIEADGRVHQLRPTDLVIGQVPPDLLEALRIEIDRANFPLIESRPFTDTCPMAYDGQETIYVFNHLMGTAWERIASCEVAIDPNHPLFAAVAAVMRTVTSEGS
ncbi:MAG TPA: hypothetical protein VFY18_05920 [Candidatus Limnocylindrales bacterium]|nr:hypothetical protein [Candidatus Limnocylindrales bacterium]